MLRVGCPDGCSRGGERKEGLDLFVFAETVSMLFTFSAKMIQFSYICHIPARFLRSIDSTNSSGILYICLFCQSFFIINTYNYVVHI